jgi:hypothetical protein
MKIRRRDDEAEGLGKSGRYRHEKEEDERE